MSVSGVSRPDMREGNVVGLTQRGYDRSEVDQQVRTSLDRLAEVERAYQHEQRRADRAEAELSDVRAQLEAQISSVPDDSGPPTSQGFGSRIEKLLRTVENEAAEARSTAAQEARALVEQARTEAEAHRHEVERSLIARTVMLDQKAAQHRIEFDERENQILRRAADVREEAERVLSEARAQAVRIEQDAHARMQDQSAQAEKAIEEHRNGAEKELDRLRSLQRDVQNELGRLLGSLAEELDDGLGVTRSRSEQAPVQDDDTDAVGDESNATDGESDCSASSTPSPEPAPISPGYAATD